MAVYKIWNGTEFVSVSGGPPGAKGDTGATGATGAAGDEGIHPVNSTDNAIARYDGTGGNLQDSGVLIDDSDNISGFRNLTGDDGQSITLIPGAALITTAAGVQFDVTGGPGGTTSGAGGKLTVGAGAAISGAGGQLILEGGSTQSGAGGETRIRGGTTGSGAGGDLVLLGRDGVTSGDGGDVTLTAGAQAGGNTNGVVQLKGHDSSVGIEITSASTPVVKFTNYAVDLNDNLLSNVNGYHLVIADATDTKTSTNTIVDDAELGTSTLETTTQYRLKGLVVFNCASATPDMKVTFTFPTSTTDILIRGMAMRGNDAWTERESGLITSSGDVMTLAHAGGGGDEWVEFDGTFKTDSTAGTCDFQWAPRVIDANDMIRMAGSYIEIVRRDLGRE